MEVNKQKIPLDKLLAKSINLLQSDNLVNAEGLCRLVLEQDAENVKALSLLGIIAYKTKRPNYAFYKLRYAASLQKNKPSYKENTEKLLNLLENNDIEEATSFFVKAYNLSTQSQIKISNTQQTKLNSLVIDMEGILNFSKPKYLPKYHSPRVKSTAPIVMVTSIAPGNIDIQQTAMQSWLDCGFTIVSLNNESEIKILQPLYKNIIFYNVYRDATNLTGKPLIYIDDALNYLFGHSAEICGIVNSDIHLKSHKSIYSYIYNETRGCFAFAPRVDIKSATDIEGALNRWGIDVFFFDKRIINRITPTKFCFGAPCWDIWFPLAARKAGLVTKYLSIPAFFHVDHATNWSMGSASHMEWVLHFVEYFDTAKAKNLRASLKNIPEKDYPFIIKDIMNKGRYAIYFAHEVNFVAQGFSPTIQNIITQKTTLPIKNKAHPKPTVRILQNMARSGGTLISKCLGSMNSVIQLSEINPFFTLPFNPLHQSKKWFELFSEEELEQLAKNEPIEFNKSISLILERCRSQGKQLLIRDWSHLDFTGIPYTPKPSFVSGILKELQDDFNIISTTSIRHPIDQWLSLRCMLGIQGRLGVEDFLKGYYYFAKHAVKKDFVRYEDFISNPDETLQILCERLSLKFDPNYRNSWYRYNKITGDNQQTISRSREKKIISGFERRPMEKGLLERFENNEHYQQAIEMLGYEHPKTTSKTIIASSQKLKNNAVFSLFDKVYCINLESAKERKKHIIQEFDNVGIEKYEIIKAIAKDSSEVFEIMQSDFVKKYPPCFRCGQVTCNCENNVLIPSQIGNWLSFIKIWKDIVKNKYRLALICEDDIKFTSYAGEIASFMLTEKKLAEHNIDLDKPFMLRLGWAKCEEHNYTKDARFISEVRMSNPCFAINLAMAEVFLNSLKQINHTSDVWMHQEIATQYTHCSLFPPICYELSWGKDAVFASHIHPKKEYLENLRGRLYCLSSSSLEYTNILKEIKAYEKELKEHIARHSSGVAVTYSTPSRKNNEVVINSNIAIQPKNSESPAKAKSLEGILKINYPPNFKPRYGYGLEKARHILAIFKNKEKEQLDFISKVAQYKKQLASIAIDCEEDAPAPRWNQDWFPPLDGISMYTMVASNKPKMYVEIGSGNSTKFAVQAIKDNQLDTQVISVDPQPRAEVDNICNRVIRNPLEEAVELEEILLSLKPNDIVFFDGSHRCLQNSDVTAFFIDYLPIIPAGVKIGIHDIFWPNDYPESWVTRYYNEQYILGAYMLALGNNFPLIFSCAYMGGAFSEKIRSYLDSKLLENLAKIDKGIGGGSLWFSK